MSRENTVILYGYLNEKPKIFVDQQTHEYVLARLTVHTVRRRIRKELKLLGRNIYDDILIRTKDKEIIKFIIKNELDKGDMVFVKGMLTTVPSIKKHTCPKCGYVNKKIGATTVCIDPIFIGPWEQGNEKLERETTNIQEESAQTILDSKYEISNMIFIWGYLCRDPDYYESPDFRKRECQFQIASDRKRRIDYSDEKTDYPWVRVYGEQAEEASHVLKTGSEIYINGSLQSRDIRKKMECQNCHYIFETGDYGVDIVPYSIEYGRNCDFSSLDEDKEEDDFIGEKEE